MAAVGFASTGKLVSAWFLQPWGGCFLLFPAFCLTILNLWIFALVFSRLWSYWHFGSHCARQLPLSWKSWRGIWTQLERAPGELLLFRVSWGSPLALDPFGCDLKLRIQMVRSLFFHSMICHLTIIFDIRIQSRSDNLTIILPTRCFLTSFRANAQTL